MAAGLPDRIQSVEQLGAVLSIFYHPATTPEARKLVDKLLREFQNTVEAWMVADSFLNVDAPQMAPLKLFGAQTLHIKLQKNWKQLPAESRVSLRNSLILHIKKAAKTPVLLQSLCLALAAYAIHTCGGEWTTAMQDITNEFGSSPETLPCLLEMLAALPEEVSDQRLHAGAALRNRFCELLNGAFPVVFQMLHQFLVMPNATIDDQNKIFDALAEWVKFGFSRMDPKVVMESPMTRAPFQALRNPELFESAENCCIELIGQTSQDPQKWSSLIVVFLTSLVELRSLLLQLLTEPDDRTEQIVAMYTDAGDLYAPLLLSGSCPQFSQPLFEALLACAAFSDWEISRHALRFWFKMIDELMELHAQRADYQTPPELVTVFCQLVFVVLRKALQFPDDFDSYTEDRKDDFRDFRKNIGELMKESGVFIGDELCLTQSWAAIQHEVSQMNVTSRWQPVEAALYTIRALARYIPEDDSRVLPRLMDLLRSLPQVHPQLHYTACLLVGRFSRWLSHHPEYVVPLFEFLTRGLSAKDVISAAAKAIRDVCEDCGALLLPALDALLKLFTQITPTLRRVPRKFLISGVSAVLCKSADANVVANGVSQMAAPFIAGLGSASNAFVSSSSSSFSPSAAEDVERNLNIIADIFGEIKLPDSLLAPGVAHPCAPLVHSIWAGLLSLLEAVAKSEKISTALCRTLKSVIRLLGTQFEPYLGPLLNGLLPLFERHRHGAYIDVVTECVSLFAKDAKYQLHLLEVFKTFTTITFQIFAAAEVQLKQQHTISSSASSSSSSSSALTPVTIIPSNSAHASAICSAAATLYPDIVCDFFEMVKIFLWRMPQLVVREPTFALTVEFAARNLRMTHRDGLERVILFLVEVVQICLPQTPVNTQGSGSRPRREPTDPAVGQILTLLIQTHGQTICSNALISAISPVSAYRMRESSLLLSKLLLLSVNVSKAWLANTLRDLFPDTVLSTEEKERFLLSVEQATREVSAGDVVFSAVERIWSNIEGSPFAPPA